VLDVGCGTGLCFPRLQSKIGADGHIIGIDESPDMLDVARGHIADSGWENVTLITAPVDEAEIPVVADAALFSAVHDILQSQPALDNVLAHLRPGAWVAAAGGKWARAGMLSLDPITYAIHQPYVRSFAGFDRPWRAAGADARGLHGHRGGVRNRIPRCRPPSLTVPSTVGGLRRGHDP
jgi:trans-aconitate methyltransferase